MAKKNVEELQLTDIQLAQNNVTLYLCGKGKVESSVNLKFSDEKTSAFCYRLLSWSLQESDTIDSKRLEALRLDGVGMKGDVSKRPYALCEKFLQMLAEDVNKGHDVQYYAKRLGVTPSYLFVVVREYTGQGPSDVIASYILNHAKHLLDCTNLSCKQISEELNFPNQSFFGKFFKKHTGLAPLEYRKKRRFVIE